MMDGLCGFEVSIKWILSRRPAKLLELLLEAFLCIVRGNVSKETVARHHNFLDVFLHDHIPTPILMKEDLLEAPSNTVEDLILCSVVVIVISVSVFFACGLV